MNHYKNKPGFKWWLLESGSLIDARNYACKMIALGGFIAYWSDEAVNLDSLRDRDYLANVINRLNSEKSDWIENVHRTSVFKTLNSYWGNLGKN